MIRYPPVAISIDLAKVLYYDLRDEGSLSHLVSGQ